MSIRKIWIGVLLDDLKVTGGERIFYEKALVRMSETEVQTIVELLESVADGAENAMEKVCATVRSAGHQKDMKPRHQVRFFCSERLEIVNISEKIRALPSKTGKVQYTQRQERIAFSV